MSNIDKVAEVMKAHDLFWYMSGNGWTEPHEEVIRCACGEEFYSHIQTGDGSYDDDRDPDALYRQHLTQALADAGLLMPDLPNPTSAGWPLINRLIAKVTLGKGGKVAILPRWGQFNETHIELYEARQLAYALLAAADHAEVQQ